MMFKWAAIIPRKPRELAPWALMLMALIPRGVAAADIMPANTADSLYKSELGPLYRPGDLPRLYAANQLIEQYFTAAAPDDRKSIVAQLQATQLDPAILGRLCRIRLDWQNLTPGVYYVNEKAGQYDVKYFLGVPRGYKRETSWPLVVKLPAANAFVTDPPPLASEVVQFYTDWTKQELAAHPDAIVLMPLLNLAELYGPSYKGINSVVQPIWNAAGKLNIDPARVYLVGHSMGAHAAWNIALLYPTYIAAINPMAGGAELDWQRIRVPNLRNVFPVIWADSLDQVVPSAQSAEIVQIMRRRQMDFDFNLTDKYGHIPPPELIESMYKKMRSHARQLYPRRITFQSNRPDTIFNRADWMQVYQPIDSGADRAARIQHGTGTIRLYQSIYTLDATLKGNGVEMTTTNVDSLRLYFNDQMVDLSRPVTVTVNNRPRFSGMLTPSIDEMMKDQLFLGRGWRYFTAVLDLELTQPTAPQAPPKPAAPSNANGTPATRPHGRITIYNDDGTVQRVIETP